MQKKRQKLRYNLYTPLSTLKKVGPKPKGKVKIKWSADFAYAIGLMVTDGNLSSDGRHISFVSKDLEQIKNFAECLGLDNKIGDTFSGYKHMHSYRIQFGDIIFYKFLTSIGLSAAKSKTIGKVEVPQKHFFDYLRGVFDGDGCIYSYWDKRWRSSYMFYISFVSASEKHVVWLRSEISNRIGSDGHVTMDGKGLTHQLKYAKRDSVELIKRMYYSKKVRCLTRKKLKIKAILAIVDRQERAKSKRI